MATFSLGPARFRRGVPAPWFVAFVALLGPVALTVATRIAPLAEKATSRSSAVALPNLRPKPWTSRPPPAPTTRTTTLVASLHEPCNTSLAVEELHEEPVITYAHAWYTFFFVLITALLWLFLACITMTQVKPSEPLPTAPHTARPAATSNLENVARSEPTKTDFTTNVCGCFANFRGFCFTLWCPCVSWADNIQRIGILDYTHAKYISLAAAGVALLAVLIWVAVSLVLATHTTVVGLHDTLLTFLGVSLASGVASILWFAFGGLFTYYRQESRRKLSLWRPDSWEADFCVSCCMWPFGISQETRHIDAVKKDGYMVRAAPPLMKLHPVLGGKRDDDCKGVAAGRK